MSTKPNSTTKPEIQLVFGWILSRDALLTKRIKEIIPNFSYHQESGEATVWDISAKAIPVTVRARREIAALSLREIAALSPTQFAALPPTQIAEVHLREIVPEGTIYCVPLGDYFCGEDIGTLIDADTLYKIMRLVRDFNCLLNTQTDADGINYDYALPKWDTDFRWTSTPTVELSWEKGKAYIQADIGENNLKEWGEVDSFDVKISKLYSPLTSDTSYQASKQIRNGRDFWYICKRQGGKLFKVYLGKAENLTADKLMTATIELILSIWLSVSRGDVTHKEVAKKAHKKRKYAKRKFSAVAGIPSYEPNDPNQLFSRMAAAKILGITPEQFDYLCEKKGFKHTSTYEAKKGSDTYTAYLYSAEVVRGMSAFVTSRKAKAK